MRVVVRVVGFLLSVLLSSAKNLIFSTFLAVSYSHESKGCRLNLKIWLTLITTINDPDLINHGWSSLSMYQFHPTCILYYSFINFFQYCSIVEIWLTLITTIKISNLPPNHRTM